MGDTGEELWNECFGSDDEDAGASSDGEGRVVCPGSEGIRWQNSAVYIQTHQSGGIIFGSLSLRQATPEDCVIVWHPADTASQTSSKYAFSTPLTAVHSIRMVRPSLGTPQVMINLRSGITHLPLYFHSGRALEFQSKLQEYATLTRCENNPATMLVNDDSNRLHRSLHGLELVPDGKEWERHRMKRAAAKLGTTSRTASQTHAGSGKDGDDAAAGHASSGADGEKECGEESGSEWQWRYLQGGACVIKSLRSGLSRASALAADAAATAHELMEQGRREPCASSAPSEAVRSGRGRLPVGQARKVPHADQRAQVEDDCVWVERELIPWQTSCALDESEFRSMFDTAGVLKDLATLRTRAYYGGLAAGVRREGWKWLLGCYPAKSTRKDREALLVAKRQEYLAYKRQWQSITPEQQARFAKFRDRRSRIEKDVVRTDRGIEMFADAAGPGLERLHAILLTYSFYNFDLSYCQGMSDLAAPLLLVMEDEVEAFWCFQQLMQRVEANFHKDQNGMHRQLELLQVLSAHFDPELLAYLETKDCSNFYFCFRWLLILYKREFAPQETMRLWEALWSSQDKLLHLFYALAILRQHKHKMMQEEMEFDEVLKFVNGLALHIDCLQTLKDADNMSQMARHYDMS